MPTPRRGNTISPISATGSFINKIVYDREERSLLAIEQEIYTTTFYQPAQDVA